MILTKKEASEHYRKQPHKLDIWEKKYGMPVIRPPESDPIYDTVAIDSWLDGFLTTKNFGVVNDDNRD